MLTPALSLTKVADPAGATVVVGDTIAYTVTASNDGETVLTDVVVTDDLTGVLGSASLRGAPRASVGDAPVVTGPAITWQGTLAPGERVAISYTVAVDAAGTIRNVASASVDTPGGVITTPPAVTEHRAVVRPPVTPPPTTPPPPPSVQPPRPGLPATGAGAVGGALGTGAALLLVGAALLTARRRLGQG